MVKLVAIIHRCMNHAQLGSAADACTAGAINKYELLLSNDKKAQYRNQARNCMAKYGDPETLSSADASYVHACQLRAVKSLAK